jgi:pyrroloquinoline quinone (PQQ) biosynthesis protein C
MWAVLEESLKRAVVVHPRGCDLDAAIAELRGAGEAAHRGDAAAYAAYHDALYKLHFGRERRTEAVRQFLAASVYDLEERHAPIVVVAEPLTRTGLEQRVRQTQAEHSVLDHPLFHLLFHGDPSRAQVLAYLKQKWIIVLSFWQSLAELALRAETQVATVLTENLYEELGEGKRGNSHLEHHYAQLRDLGVDAQFSDTPTYPETQEYLNNRVRCMRHPEMVLGLGVAYSMEAASQGYSIQHAKMLRRIGAVSHVDVYDQHDEVDDDHSADILEAILSHATTAQQQQLAVSAQAHQQKLWLRHFTRVHETLRTMNPTS